jgi:hypothetical protein
MTVCNGQPLEPDALPLGGGISSLAAVAAVSSAATLVLIATTAAGISWPDISFRLLAAAMAAAVIVAQARSFSLLRLPFALGVLLTSLPSLVIAARIPINHWDDFWTWLPNAFYIWHFGALPTPANPPVASYLPGYPPGSSIILAAVWSAAGRVLDHAGPMLNVACLMVLPGVVLRALGLGLDRPPLQVVVLGAVLGALATVLNVGVDWHWVLSSLAETATMVAFAAAFQLGAEALFRRSQASRSKLIALAALLAFVVNLKQTGVALTGILLVALSLDAFTWRRDDSRSLRESILTLTLVAGPSIVMWLGWHFYLTRIFHAYAVGFRPFGEWYFALLPTLLAAIAQELASHWLFTIPIAIVVLRGCYILARRFIGGDRTPPTAADRLAAIFALVEAGYSAFLVVCYIGAFDKGQVSRADEWSRYQAQIGAAGLLVALALAAERLRQVRFATLAAAAALVPFAMAWTLSSAAGVYEWEGILNRAEVQSIRKLGREAGKLVAAPNQDANIELVVYDPTHSGGLPFMRYVLASLIMRYEIWASAPLRIRSFKDHWSGEEADVAVQMRAAIQRGAHAVAIGKDLDCAVYAWSGRVSLIANGEASAACVTIAAQLTEQPTQVRASSPDLR